MSTPLKAIRLHCLECCNGSSVEVGHCPASSCPLHSLRKGRKPKEGEFNPGTRLHPLESPMTAGELLAKPGPALKAIKRRCLDCSDNNYSIVRNCTDKTCALHGYRQGRNPKLAGVVRGASKLIVRPKTPASDAIDEQNVEGM